jgi:hypothetical protein
MSSASAVLSSPSVERVRQALERAGLAIDIVRRHTGFAIGGVAPAGHITNGTPAELAA